MTPGRSHGSVSLTAGSLGDTPSLPSPCSALHPAWNGPASVPPPQDALLSPFSLWKPVAVTCQSATDSIICDRVVAVGSLFLSPWGFPGSSVHKESTCNAGDPGLIPGSGRSAGEGIGYLLQYSWASLVAQLAKNLPAMWESCVQSLGWEDPLKNSKDYPLQYSGLENSMD